MSLVVKKSFHLNGVMKKVGDVLSHAEQSLVENDPEKLRRCLRNLTHQFHEPIPPAQPSPPASSARKAAVSSSDAQAA